MDGSKSYLKEQKNYIIKLENAIVDIIDTRYSNKPLLHDRKMEILELYDNILQERKENVR